MLRTPLAVILVTCCYTSLQSNVLAERPREPRSDPQGSSVHKNMENVTWDTGVHKDTHHVDSKSVHKHSHHVDSAKSVHKNAHNVDWHILKKRKELLEAEKLLKEHRSNLKLKAANNQIDWRSVAQDENSGSNNWIPLHPIVSDDLKDSVRVDMEKPLSEDYRQKIIERMDAEKYAARFKGGLFEELESEENVRLARDPKYYLPQYPGKFPYGGYGGYPNYGYPKHPYGYYGNHHYPVIPPKKYSPTTTTGNTDAYKSPAKPNVPSTLTPEGQVPIIYNHFEGPLPSFSYSYITGNGIQQSARGEIKQIGDEEGVVMSGSYSYVGPDGVTYEVDWIADENGFQPTGAHLPSPPDGLLTPDIKFPERSSPGASQQPLPAQRISSEVSQQPLPEQRASPAASKQPFPVQRTSEKNNSVQPASTFNSERNDLPDFSASATKTKNIPIIDFTDTDAIDQVTAPKL